VNHVNRSSGELLSNFLVTLRSPFKEFFDVLRLVVENIILYRYD